MSAAGTNGAIVPSPADRAAIEVARASDVERYLLGALLHLGYVPSSVAHLSPTDFIRPEHGVLWKLIADRIAEYGAFDAGMVLVGPDVEPRLRTAGLDVERAREILQGAYGLVVTGTGADLYAREVREAAARRRLQRGTQRVQLLLADGYPAAEALDALREVAHREELALPATTRNDGAALEVRSAADLVAEPEEAIDELWPGVIARGLFTLFAGQAKAGKSWLLTAMVAALSQGRSWGGRSRASVRILYVTEEGARTTRRRLRRFGVGAGVDVLTPKELPAAWPWERQSAAVIDRAVADGYELVIFDTLLGLAGLPPDAANDDGAAGAALAPIARGAHARGLAVVASHHARKEDGDGGRAIFGGLAFRRVPDVLVELRHVGSADGPEREVRVSGRLEDAPPKILVRHVPGEDGTPDSYAFLGAPAEARSRTIRDTIRGALLAELKWMSRDVLLRRVGGRRADAIAALDALVESGDLRTQGDGARGNPRIYGLAELADDAPRLLRDTEAEGSQ